jgi:O-antigen ligase
MTAQAKKKQARATSTAGAKPTAAKPTVAGTKPTAATAGGAGASWLVDTSWSLLIASLVIVPLLITNMSWLRGGGGTWLQGGAPALKALAAQMLIAGSLAFFAAALLRRQVAIRWHRVAWLGVAFVTWAGVTVLTSVSPATSLIGSALTSEGWVLLATAGTAAFLTLQLADTPSRIRELLRAASLTAGVVAVYGLLQTAGLDPLKWQPGEWGLFRSFGTIGNPDMFGAYMVLNLFVLVGLALGETDRRWRAGYTVAGLAVAVATYTSLTRAAWIGAVAGAVVFALLAMRLRPRFTRANVVVALVLLAIVAGATVLSLSNSDIDSNVISRIRTAFDPTDKNTLGRTETWRVSAVAIGKRPVVGYGPDTFGQAFQVNKSEQFARLVEPNIVQANAHSAIIQLAVENGVPGAVLWLALLAGVATVSLPVASAAAGKDGSARLLLAGVVASCAGYVIALLLTPTSAASTLQLWCMLAVLVSPVAHRSANAVARWVAAAPIVLGTVGAVVAIAFLFAGTRAAVADDETIASPVRIAAADQAVEADPLSAEYAAVAAKAYAQSLLQAPSTESSGALAARFDTANAQMRRSVALEPTDTHRRSTLVSLLLIGGQKVDPRYSGEAVTVAAAAVRNAPNDLETAYWYARALFADDQSARAVPVLVRALGLRPGYTDAAILLSDLYVARGDTSDARAVLERALPLAADTTALQQRLDALKK